MPAFLQAYAPGHGWVTLAADNIAAITRHSDVWCRTDGSVGVWVRLDPDRLPADKFMPCAWLAFKSPITLPTAPSTPLTGLAVAASGGRDDESDPVTLVLEAVAGRSDLLPTEWRRRSGWLPGQRDALMRLLFDSIEDSP